MKFDVSVGKAEIDGAEATLIEMGILPHITQASADPTGFKHGKILRSGADFGQVADDGRNCAGFVACFLRPKVRIALGVGLLGGRGGAGEG